jgi:hypothetical protein
VKGDIREWIEKTKATAEQLYQIIEQLPEWQPNAKPEPAELDLGNDKRLLAEMNRDNCVVPDGGKTWVLRFSEVERRISSELYRYREPTFMGVDHFKNLYVNRLVNVGKDKPRWIPLGHWWFRHRNRRQHTGVAYVPPGAAVINGYLNLWQGWGVEPKQGDWSLLRDHIYEVLAARDDDADRYIMNWLGWCAQHPDEQAETALVFISERGSGKGTLGNAMCRIFGQHARHISSPDHLTGKFNHHLRYCSGQIAMQEVVQHRCIAAVFQLRMDLTKIFEVLALGFGDPENCEAPFVCASRHHPIVVAGDHDVQAIGDLHSFAMRRSTLSSLVQP